MKLVKRNSYDAKACILEAIANDILALVFDIRRTRDENRSMYDKRIANMLNNIKIQAGILETNCDSINQD